jgi:hypothetical protein
MAERLTAELLGLSEKAAPLGVELVNRAETRFRRIVEAFRDRLNRNIREATGISVSPMDWAPKAPALRSVPLALSATFMTHWDLLWWLLPMRLVGGIFRRHVVGRVPWEVEKNLIRLTGDWTATIDAAVADLCSQASAWVDAELATLERLLSQPATEAPGFREALHRLEKTGVLQPT